MSDPWYIRDPDTGYIWTRTVGWTVGPVLIRDAEYTTLRGARQAANRLLELGRVRSYEIIKWSRLQQESPSCRRERPSKSLVLN